MRRVLTALAVLTAMTTIAAAQITHSETIQYVIDDVSAADIDGNCLVLQAGEIPVVAQTTLISLAGAEGYSILPIAKEPTGRPVRVAESGNGGFRIYVATEAWVTLFCTNFDTKTQELVDIVINRDVTPDPEPEPGPGPDPDDGDGTAPMVAKAIVFLEETSQRGLYPDQTAAMMDTEMWSVMNDRGLSIRIFDKDQPAASKYVTAAQGELPAMILVGMDESTFRVFPTPETSAGIEKVVRENVVR